jgi:hypothetical protein
MHRSSRGSRQSTTERLIRYAGNWTGLWDRLVALNDAAQQGAAFERLTQLLLQTLPEYQSKLKHVWLLSEVPQEVRAKLRLPQLDEGIDLVAETYEGTFWAIQSKFRSERDGTLTRKDLDTFTSLAFVTCTGISVAVTGGEKREDVNGAPKTGRRYYYLALSHGYISVIMTQCTFSQEPLLGVGPQFAGLSITFRPSNQSVTGLRYDARLSPPEDRA